MSLRPGDVALVEGLLAFTLLIGLQFVIAWLSVRSSWVQSLVKSEPTLLLYQGQFLRAKMCRERVSQEEIEAAVRQEGISDPADIAAVVLETDGAFSVIQQSEQGELAKLAGVQLPLRREIRE